MSTKVLASHVAKDVEGEAAVATEACASRPISGLGLASPRQSMGLIAHCAASIFWFIHLVSGTIPSQGECTDSEAGPASASKVQGQMSWHVVKLNGIIVGAVATAWSGGMRRRCRGEGRKRAGARTSIRRAAPSTSNMEMLPLR